MGAGEVLIKTTHLVVSPPPRMALGTGGIAGKPLPIGSLMRGSGQSRVVQSKRGTESALPQRRGYLFRQRWRDDT